MRGRTVLVKESASCVERTTRSSEWQPTQFKSRPFCERAWHRPAERPALELRRLPRARASGSRRNSRAGLSAGRCQARSQKGLLLNCVGCHSLERVVRSTHDADSFTKTVLPRMQGYVNQSIPQHPQLRKAERLMEERGDQRVQVYRSTAEYLATINRGPAQKWSYELKTLPRPSGRATRVVYTEYDLPRETISPHDVIVDSEGIAWYSR